MEHLRDDDNEEEEGEFSPYGSQAYTVMSTNDLCVMGNRVFSLKPAILCPFHMSHTHNDNEEEGESSPLGSQAYFFMNINDL